MTDEEIRRCEALAAVLFQKQTIKMPSRENPYHSDHEALLARAEAADARVVELTRQLEARPRPRSFWSFIVEGVVAVFCAMAVILLVSALGFFCLGFLYRR